MSHLLTTRFLLLIFAAAILSLNFSVAAQPPQSTSPPQNDKSDPAADADFYLDKATTKIAQLQTFAESLRNEIDLRRVPFRPVVFSKRDIAQARATLELAKAQISQLPENVNANRRRSYQRLLRQIQRLDSYLTMIRTSLLASLNPKAFPSLKTDALRFRGIGMMFANIDSFESDPLLAAVIVEQLPAAQQEAIRIAAKYDLLIQQETIAGMQLAGLERYFESKRKSFEAIVKQQQQDLPERIKDELASLQQTLLSRSERRLSTPTKTDSDEKPVGLHSQLRKIEADIKLLETINPQSTALLMTYRKQVVDLSAVVKKTEPADLYVGDARDEVVRASSLWGLEIDSKNIRIPSKDWARRSYWRSRDGQWRKIDRSVLDVYLLSKESNDAGTSWQRYLLTKDHLNSDAITVRRDE